MTARAAAGAATTRAPAGPTRTRPRNKGAWISIWVDDVDAVHECALAEGIEVTFPPTDEPWNVREMHVRHPDGHVFRISRAT